MNVKVDSKIEIEIVNMYTQGMGVMQICKKLNLDKATIRKYLIKNSIVYNKDKRVKLNKVEIGELYNKITNLWKLGYGISEISQIVNRYPSNVTYMLYKIFGKDKVKGDRFHFTKSGRKWNLNENFFREIDTEEKAYILGFIYADGCIENINKTLRLFLNEKDKNILERFNFILEYDKPLEYIPKIETYGYENTGPQFGIIIACRRVYNDLLKIGLHPAKTLTIEFPTSKQVPEHLIQHFIRGYFDGDGSVNKITSSPVASFACNEKFADSLIYIIYNMSGILLKKSKHSIGNVYYCKIQGRLNLISLYYFMYKDATIFLDRKRENFIAWINKKGYEYNKKAHKDN